MPFFFINFGTRALGCTRQKKGSLKICSTEFMNFQYVKRPIADICHEKKILETFVKSFSPYLICLLGNCFSAKINKSYTFPKEVYILYHRSVHNQQCTFRRLCHMLKMLPMPILTNYTHFPKKYTY